MTPLEAKREAETFLLEAGSYRRARQRIDESDRTDEQIEQILAELKTLESEED